MFWLPDDADEEDTSRSRSKPVKKSNKSSKLSKSNSATATKVIPARTGSGATAVKQELDNSDADTARNPKKVKVTSAAQELKEGKKSTRRVIHTNNIRVNDLPDFATKENRWRNVFLPTLYDKFFSSPDPFSRFLKGTEKFISLLQDTLDEVYPNIKYTVSARDPIHAVSYNRINEKRSAIGAMALKVVKDHLDSLDDEKARRDWLVWASRSDGPLFFKKPVDPKSPRDREDPAYVHPSGHLLSTFIINLFTSFIRLKAGSILDSNHPRGLVALIMAALERGVKSLRPGHKVEEFSNGLWGAKVIAYYGGLANVDENQWNALLEAAKIDVKEADEDSDEEYRANVSFMDNTRAVVFNFASPVKGY
ncbi:hypothetical protein BJ165DRAFT_1400729 [Panaeolus papilionaceus]|nr:hypothetical protein BJ165DRAFT_1400729 [Panaeolus papilionaceus]